MGHITGQGKKICTPINVKEGDRGGAQGNHSGTCMLKKWWHLLVKMVDWPIKGMEEEMKACTWLHMLHMLSVDISFLMRLLREMSVWKISGFAFSAHISECDCSRWNGRMPAPERYFVSRIVVGYKGSSDFILRLLLSKLTNSNSWF